MLLKVGELAKRSGLTVRTLHHYDEIGLLVPSGRSEAGYRLYSAADVQRLHGIQALRHLGLPLQDIAGLLAADDAKPDRILAQQMRALDQQIAQASELRARLALLRDGLIAGTKPDTDNWLDTLSLMATYGKYFSAAELKTIFSDWKKVEAEWLPLMEKVRALMDRGLAPDALEVQPLVHRWMSLMLHWMDGDLALIDRWGEMYRLEPSAHGRYHAPQGDMIAFIEKAIKLRLALLEKYVTMADLKRLGHVPVAEWDALEARVAGLLHDKQPPGSPEARAAALHWGSLLDRLTRNDAALRDKLALASRQEPVLRAGAPLSPAVRDYLTETLARTLDPDAA